MNTGQYRKKKRALKRERGRGENSEYLKYFGHFAKNF